MALTLSNSGIISGSIIKAAEISQSIDAFTGVEAYDINLSGSLAVTGSTTSSLGFYGSLTGLATSASYVQVAKTSITASYALTASRVDLAQTASYVLNAVSSSYAESSSYALSSSYTLTASYAVSASVEITKEVSSSYADTASYVELVQTASYVVTSSYALISQRSITSDTASYVATSSWALISLDSEASTLASTASYVALAQSALTSTSSSYSLSGSISDKSITTSITEASVSVGNAAPNPSKFSSYFGNEIFIGAPLIITAFATELVGKQFGTNAFISITQYGGTPNPSVLYFTTTLDSGTGHFTLYDGVSGASNASIMYTLHIVA